MDVQQEAEQAWDAWSRTWPTPGGTNAPKTEEQAFLAGAEWAVASRDQRIKELEEQLQESLTLLRIHNAGVNTENTAAFIALTRTAAPQLAEEVIRLTARLEKADALAEAVSVTHTAGDDSGCATCTALGAYQEAPAPRSKPQEENG